MANKEAKESKEKYLDRLRHILRNAPPEIREDVILEVETHIDDKWRSLGGKPHTLKQVLQQLGSPDEYGKDLAFQLMLFRGRQQRSVKLLLLAALFWITSSLIGAATMIFLTLISGYALGMVFVAMERLRGGSIGLIDSTGFRFFSYSMERFYFPPETWHPAIIGLIGLFPPLVAFSGLYLFYIKWARSRLTGHGLSIIMKDDSVLLSHGWEHRAILTMLAFGIVGLSGCAFFSVASNMISIGQPGSLQLPADFFKTPLSVFAFFGFLVFLISPILGLLLAARQTRSKPNEHL
jgi:hypothetical protein